MMKLFDVKYLTQREKLEFFASLDPEQPVPAYLVAGMLHYMVYGVATPNAYEAVEAMRKKERAA